jgi:DNA-binding NarL/FixJ family response regulator
MMLPACRAGPHVEPAEFRVLLADDHDVVRWGVQELVRERRGWEVCCEATDGREAVALATEFQHQAVVLDLTMPGLDGLQATREIVKASPATRVLIFTAHDSPALVREAVACGAHGVVLKTDGAAQLLRGLDALAMDQRFYSPGVPRVPSEAAPTMVQPARAGLTPRELEILRFLAEGKSNWCTGTILGISVRTVETHRAKIMHKLGLESIVELVLYAVRQGIVHP